MRAPHGVPAPATPGGILTCACCGEALVLGCPRTGEPAPDVIVPRVEGYVGRAVLDTEPPRDVRRDVRRVVVEEYRAIPTSAEPAAPMRTPAGAARRACEACGEPLEPTGGRLGKKHERCLTPAERAQRESKRKYMKDWMARRKNGGSEAA